MLGFFKKCFSSWSQEAQHAFSCHVLFRERSHESLLSNRWCWNINSISSGFEKSSYIHFLHVLRLTMSIDLVLICQIWRWLPLYQPSATYVKQISFLRNDHFSVFGWGQGKISQKPGPPRLWTSLRAKQKTLCNPICAARASGLRCICRITPSKWFSQQKKAVFSCIHSSFSVSSSVSFHRSKTQGPYLYCH